LVEVFLVETIGETWVRLGVVVDHHRERRALGSGPPRVRLIEERVSPIRQGLGGSPG
jgi:hypothetical protein